MCSFIRNDEDRQHADRRHPQPSEDLRGEPHRDMRRRGAVLRAEGSRPGTACGVRVMLRDWFHRRRSSEDHTAATLLHTVVTLNTLSGPEHHHVAAQHVPEASTSNPPYEPHHNPHDRHQPRGP
jgi:hypothetical protein